MDEQERSAVDEIARDRYSGATTLALRAADLLRAAAARPEALREIAAACVRAQPSMAGLLTLEAALRDAGDPAGTIDKFREQVRRAPRAIARQVVPLLRLGARQDESGRPRLRLVTCSSSQAVEESLLALARDAAVTVSCAEGSPAREGAGLAMRLARAGLPVELFTDAGISTAMPGADAFLVGADAVGREHFVNKVGTAALCARAVDSGVPTYVLAGREKLLSSALFSRLVLPDGPAEELSPDLPGVILRNPYFEQIPLRLIALVVSDSGTQYMSV